MYGRIARAKFQTDTSEEVIKVARESIPTFQRLPGFQSVTYLYDRTSGWGVSMSLWDTAEHADAAAAGTRSVVEQFAPFRANASDTPNVVEGALPTFEVIGQG